MKIMFCVLCLSYGGAEKNLCIIANDMVDRGHDVVICNMNTLPTVQKTNDKIKIIDMPRFTKRFVKRIQQIQYIKELCEKEHPDLMVSFLFMPNFLSVLAGKLAGVPVIYTTTTNLNQPVSTLAKVLAFSGAKYTTTTTIPASSSVTTACLATIQCSIIPMDMQSCKMAALSTRQEKLNWETTYGLEKMPRFSRTHPSVMDALLEEALW